MRKSVVLKGHTLGVVYPFGRTGKLLQLQILHSSILRGSQFSGSQAAMLGTVMFNPETDDFREATEQDFDDFLVMSHPDYFGEFVDHRVPGD